MNTEHDLQQYYPQVKQMALKWHNRIGGIKSSLDFDDLYHEGLVGLCDALSKYDEKKGKFWSYAQLRANGAIVDFIRKSSPLPQKKAQKVKTWKKACEDLAKKLGREPTDQEVAQKLDLSLEEIHKIKNLGLRYESLEDAGEIEDSKTPLDSVERQKLHQDTDDCLKKLSDKETLILIARNQDGVPLRELATSFNVSIETVRRREMASLKKMKACMESKDWSLEDAKIF